MQNWTAFLRLKGDALPSKEEELLEAFEGFIQSLRGVNLDCNIIVLAEDNDPRLLRQLKRAGSPETTASSERNSA